MSLDEIRVALPGLPVDDEGPVFAAPWQAQAPLRCMNAVYLAGTNGQTRYRKQSNKHKTMGIPIQAKRIISIGLPHLSKS